MAEFSSFAKWNFSIFVFTFVTECAHCYTHSMNWWEFIGWLAGWLRWLALNVHLPSHCKNGWANGQVNKARDRSFELHPSHIFFIISLSFSHSHIVSPRTDVRTHDFPLKLFYFAIITKCAPFCARYTTIMTTTTTNNAKTFCHLSMQYQQCKMNVTHLR